MGDILVVDDCKSNLCVLRSILEGEGIRADYAASGEEAFKKLIASPRFTLMVTDFNMPNMDGIELAMLAKEVSPKITVVMMTGAISSAVVQMAADAGISTVLPKPFTPEQILAVIKSRKSFSW